MIVDVRQGRIRREKKGGKGQGRGCERNIKNYVQKRERIWKKKV